MTVYVDDMYTIKMGEYKRFSTARVLKMSHMISDDENELHEMADKIGVQRKWYQGDHYDIAMTKRALAVKYGAVEVTMRQLACMLHVHKRTGKMPAPEKAEALMKKMIGAKKK